MTRKLRRWLLIAVIAAAVLCLCLSRTEGFVHTFTTPKYVREATAFWQENEQELDRLLLLSEGAAESAAYQFQASDTGADFSPEMLQLLRELENKTDRPYHVFIAQNEVEILIKSGGNYEVFLTGGEQRTLYGVTEAWEQTTTLNDRWAVQAPYLQRG